MFGIGSTELLVILVVALIVLGPKSIPGIAKTLGKAMGEFRRVSTEFQRTMNAEVAQDEHEKRKKEAEEELFGSKAAPKAEPAPASQAAPQPAQAPASAAATEIPPPPAATVTVDAATGVQASPDSPLAQAVARTEAQARGQEPLAHAAPDASAAQSAHAAPEQADKSGEKA